MRSLHLYFSPEGGSQARLLYWHEGLSANAQPLSSQRLNFFIFRVSFSYFCFIHLLANFITEAQVRRYYVKAAQNYTKTTSLKSNTLSLWLWLRWSLIVLHKTKLFVTARDLWWTQTKPDAPEDKIRIISKTPWKNLKGRWGFVGSVEQTGADSSDCFLRRKSNYQTNSQPGYMVAED